jgi:peptidoglycan/xylan/chitin deacetylase (PgdA/CDA1 family)
MKQLEAGEYRYLVRWVRLFVIFATVAFIVLAGCASGPRAGHGAALGRSSAAASSGTRPSAGSPLSPSPSGTAAGVDPAMTDPSLAPFLAKLPIFGPPPVPQPIAIPAGSAAPIYKRLPITQPVAFLTMDDGETQLPEAIPLMRAAHVPFTMFLIAPVAAKNPAFFRQLESAGGVIEDHTITHPELRGKSYAFQHHEICDARTSLQHTFGINPTLGRPPFGDYDQTTLRVTHDCGLRAALYWSETVNYGKVYYQTSVHKIAPGDIILMHFRPAFVQDVIAALTAIHDAGLTPALLENYLG